MENPKTQDNATTQPADGGDCVDRPVRRYRDLAIDAAIHAIIRLVEPTISNADIQRWAETQVYRSGYLAKLDGEPICAVELDGSRRFTISILVPHQPNVPHHLPRKVGTPDADTKESK